MALSWLSLTAASCQPDSQAAIPLIAAIPEPAPVAEAIAAFQAQAQQTVPPAGSAPILLYRLDNQCQDYLPEATLVDPEQPITDAVGQILLNQDIIAFDLSGYRVSRSTDDTITIDFRLDPDSQRQLVSLADCEQKALFGSLRQTLIRSEWGISQVQFTNRGEPLLI